MTLAAAAAIAAAAATGVVALAFALYAVMTPYVGQAGGAAIVAVVAAFLVLTAGLIAAGKARGAHQHRNDAPPDRGMVELILNLVRERPLVSAGAAVAVAVFAMRNPSFVAALVRAFVDQRPQHPKE
ncbi:MAG: hypothetical protein JWM33_3763 [Caulobacteraceae bacterium]|nr:hypothetical protein [Caulobacteraceae bacterium]